MHLPLGDICLFQNIISQYSIWLQTIDILNKCKWNNKNKILWVRFLLLWFSDQKPCITVTNYSVSLESFKNSSNNGACALKLSVYEVYKDETIETK